MNAESRRHSAPEAIFTELREIAHYIERVFPESAADLREDAQGLEEQLEAAQRKVDAYDRARAQVKIEGATRAELVLRAEASQEQLEALQPLVELAGLVAADAEATGDMVLVDRLLMAKLRAAHRNVSSPASEPEVEDEFEDYYIADENFPEPPDPNQDSRPQE